MADIVVVGSLNIDFLIKIPRYPEPGETLEGYFVKITPGGKGGNQAVAAAKLGARVAFIGRTGTDVFASILRESLEAAGVDITYLFQCKDEFSGMAFVTVDDWGENSIVIIPGANNQCSPEDINKAEEQLAKAKVVLLQLEIPLETVIHTVKVAHRYNAKIVLDPAPPRRLPAEVYSMVDIMIPNQKEVSMLTGIPVNKKVDNAIEASLQLLKYGVKIAIVKLGSEGAILSTKEAIYHIPSFQVDVIDTTAAGDAFAGGLAVALSEGKDLCEAVRFANAAGALASTKLGAQESMPLRVTVEELLRVGDKYCKRIR